MKLISLNVALFETNNLQLSEFLIEQNPDVVCLQEVTRNIDNKADKNYLSKAAIDQSTSKLTHSFYGPSMVMGDFILQNFKAGKNVIFKIGGHLEFGLYTKSVFPLTKGRSIFVENQLTFSADYSNWPEEDYRSVLVTDHVINNKHLRVINYHGIWTRDKLGNAKTLNANQTILKLAQEALGEVIIAGDFNLFPDTPSMKVFENDYTSLIDRYSIKTTRPSSNELNSVARNVVDYVWVSGGIKVNNFEVIDCDVSDHLPLVVDFEL